ncbi:tRNA-splicing endonuclease subunit Sen15 [Ampelomyces quisqualis]|uniref:tRNA-splicing endonuclease subunit Sen15 n=1 Tax=Ampelomyces quisqualis TaxID=50730 RepID=A0A6A5QT41_AMPQU|nr:tRNA-splicing endonuclease subunit Sen15 [Ampelomyces quisqualis]
MPSPAPAPLQQAVASGHISAGHLPHLQSLAVQVQHNLQHQHAWSDLHVHTHSPRTHARLPRPLVSGLPAQRLYLHPDEQAALLRDADRKRRATTAAGAAGRLHVEAPPEREWILPTRLNEKWTLRRLAAVFDAIPPVPPAPATAAAAATADSARPDSPWRATKRVLLGTVDSDSTVVYYIVHDGAVKPRQN